MNEPDYIPDFKISEEDRDLVIADNDAVMTADFETIQQAIAIRVGNEIKRLLGETLTAQTLDQIRGLVRRELENIVRLSSVDPVRIDEIDRRTETVSFIVRTELNREFRLEV